MLNRRVHTSQYKYRVSSYGWDGKSDPPAPGLGGIRDSAIADALRADVARDALTKAASLLGIEHVEEFMQSGSVLLQRAMLFQESWLHNKASDLSTFSLYAPYLCPFAWNLLMVFPYRITASRKL